MIHSTMIRRSALVGLALAVVLPISQAMANDDPAEAKGFLDAGMTVAQAASAAESADTGTAMSVAWEPSGSGAMAFAVELANTDGTVKTVLVDPHDGKVKAWTDHYEGEDSNDEGEDSNDEGDRHHSETDDEEEDH